MSTKIAIVKVIAAHRCYKQFVYEGSPPYLCLCGATFFSTHLHDLHVAEKIGESL